MIYILYHIKKITFYLAAAFVLTGLGITAHAQDQPANDQQTNDNNNAQEKIEALKEAYLTRQLDLNPKEAEKFWPVYNQYRKDMQKIIEERRQNQLNQSKLNPADNKEIEQSMNRNFQLEQEALQIRQKYRRKFQDVLPPRKVMKVYKSERDFNMKLIEELHRRQNNRGMRPKNNRPFLQQPTSEPERMHPRRMQPRTRPNRQNPPQREFHSGQPRRSHVRPSGS